MAETPQDNIASIPVKNPRTGEVLYSVRECSDDDVAEVYRKAAAAHQTLRGTTVEQRVAETLKLRDYIRDQRESICRRVVEETGKCRTDALLTEVYAALDIIAYYAKHAVKFLADQSVKTPIVLKGKQSKIFYEPLGTVLVIAPWNYPFNLSFIPAISAFLAGNAVVIKPSTQTPLKGVYEDMIAESGFMKDAIQVVYGSRKTGHKLIEAQPAKIFFTGSTAGGRAVMAQAATHLIPVELELGGKDPMIVFDDAPLERAANGLLWGGLVNCGQTCTSVERLYVQAGVFDRFVALLREKIAALTTWDTLEGQDGGHLCIGCMTTDFQLETIEDQLAKAKAKGAKVVCGGVRKPGSHVFPPTVVTDTDPSMAIVREETFGPVIVAAPFTTEQEAIDRANDSVYGLSASVWSTDLARAERVARALVTGNVSINNVLATQGNPALPFGGAKHSGFGRYRGPFGLHAFSNVKSVMIDKSRARTELNWYPYTQEKFACSIDSSARSSQANPWRC